MEKNNKPLSQRHSTDNSTAADTSTEPTDTNTDNQTRTAEENTCPDCGGTVLTDDRKNETACTDCGLVIEDTGIDHGPEWRAFNHKEEQEKSRVGSPTTDLMHDKGLSTTISSSNRDGYGKQISGEKRSQLNRLRKWNERTKQDSKNRSRVYANSEIKRMGGALGISRQPQETASQLYKQAHSRDLVPGRSVEAIASAALYISLRIHNNPRSLDEITTVARVEKKKIQSAYRYLCRELDIALKPIDPEQYIERIIDNIPIPNSDEALQTTQTETHNINPKQDFEDIINKIPHDETTRNIGSINIKQLIKQHLNTEAKEILSHVARTHHTSGHDPTVLAATAVYAASIASGIPLTQNSVKQAADVTEVSIRKNYTKLLIESPHIPLIENDITDDDTPKDISQKLNDNITYLNSKISQ